MHLQDTEIDFFNNLGYPIYDLDLARINRQSICGHHPEGNVLGLAFAFTNKPMASGLRLLSSSAFHE